LRNASKGSAQGPFVLRRGARTFATMPAFVTVAEFSWATDLAVAKSRLEDEGFDCRLQDEHTVQVHNLYAQAVGGIKLQVPPHQAEAARARLLEWGFIRPGAPEGDAFWQAFDRRTRVWPVIGRIELPMARLLALVALVLTLLLGAIAWATRASVAERLVSAGWCIDEVMHEGLALQPASTNAWLQWGSCREALRFEPDGTVLLPGFDGPQLEAEWHIEGGRLWLVADSLNPVYVEPFSVEVDGRQLFLVSQGARIRCSRMGITG